MQIDYYRTLYRKSETELEKEKQHYEKTSLYRFISSITACLLFILSYTQKNSILCLLGISAVLLFIILVWTHSKIAARQQHFTNLKEVAGDYLARYDENWKQFKVTGTQYLSDGFPQAKDLDLFGEHSLYQYICTASTVFGQDCLAKWLQGGVSDLQAIRKRQQAAAEIAGNKDFCITYETLARTERNLDYAASKKVFSHFFDSIRSTNKNSSKYPLLLLLFIWILPVITVSLLFLGIFGVNRDFTLSCFVLLVFVQLGIVLIGSHWNNMCLNPISQLNRTITPYRKLIETIEQETFQSDYLCDLQKLLCQNGSASDALNELEHITDAVNARKNYIAFILYNGLYLHDFHCCRRFTGWKKKYQNEVALWLDTVGQIEALICLGVIAHTKDTCTLPEFEDTHQPHLSALCLKHPLLSENSAVGNDITLKHRTCIITGSNMSGKTTFIRSIGVNLYLAYAGGYVSAQSFCASPMAIYSSMRNEDSVSNGISTFYAELLRIKSIIEFSRQSFPMIVLIDEIYKGTNSKDRITGAAATVKNLALPHVLTIFTTHDLELCELEQDPDADAENYHFSEHYDNDKILFDYSIKKGRGQTTNAQYLLRMVGIID